MNKRLWLVLAVLTALPLMYNNCGLSNMTPAGSRGSGSGATVGDIVGITSSCEEALAIAFTANLYPFVQSKCASCHYQGGVGKGAFADPNVTKAFSEYKAYRSFKIFDKSIDSGHNAGVTGGPLNIPTVNQLSPKMTDAETAFGACGGDVANPPPPLIPDPNPQTFVVLTPVAVGDVTAGRDIVFNLGTGIMLPAGKTFPGATATIRLQSTVSPTGDRAYQVSNPRVRGATATALLVKSLRVEINSTSNNQITYATIDRKVPINTERVVGQGGMVIQYNFATTDTVRLTFIALDATTFNPVPFTTLIAAGGVISQQCTSCHGADGGLTITTRANLVNQGYAVPFDPVNSIFLQRMKGLGGGFMPPAGKLPDAQIQQVEDWIYDGAP